MAIDTKSHEVSFNGMSVDIKTAMTEMGAILNNMVDASFKMPVLLIICAAYTDMGEKRA